ncbi:MAG TPA: hypothetical protein VF339_18520 [Gammaproteobacteria bacterium]
MAKRLDVEDARAIVVQVLARHGLAITDKGSLDLLSDGLGIASDDEFFLVASTRAMLADQKARLERIAALEKLSGLYAIHEEHVRPSLTRGWMPRLHRKSLDEVLSDLAALLETERFVENLYDWPRLPNSRPPSAKNEGARCICEVLVEHGIGLWKACGIIADMFVAAGITEHKERERRALYDKLNRTPLVR